MIFEMSCLELVCRKIVTNSGRPGVHPERKIRLESRKRPYQAATVVLGGCAPETAGGATDEGGGMAARAPTPPVLTRDGH
jgi:hypothetical protein